MRKAIITFGVGYGFDDIKYFIHSCYRHVPDAEIFIYTGKNTNALKERCRVYPQVHLIRHREGLVPKIISKLVVKFPALARSYARLLMTLSQKEAFSGALLNAFATALVQFMVKRFFIIKSLIQTLPHHLIMLTDIRDVVIQADPFKGIGPRSIITGVEPVKNEESEMNKRWIISTYSEGLLETLKDLPVACAGVTIGSRVAIKQYVDEMICDTYQNLDKIIGMLGADQAIHIKLFYQGLQGLDRQLKANGTGSIATLHFSTLTEFSAGAGRIENRTGETLAVVHQYDRHPMLAADLKKQLDSDMQSTLTKAA